MTALRIVEAVRRRRIGGGCPRASRVAAAAAGLLACAAARADEFDLPLVSKIGCALVEWMTGPLAVVVFLIVVISTLVIGIFAKMDWTRILTVIIIYGIIQGLVAGTFKLDAVKKPEACQKIGVFTG